jgi:hypothetical protein
MGRYDQQLDARGVPALVVRGCPELVALSGSISGHPSAYVPGRTAVAAQGPAVESRALAGQPVSALHDLRDLDA